MTAPSAGAVGDARKRDQETHWDPAVRALIAEAVQAERERVLAQVVTRIVEAAPSLNAELRHDGTSDPLMSAYVEGFHDAWSCVSSIARDGGR